MRIKKKIEIKNDQSNPITIGPVSLRFLIVARSITQDSIRVSFHPDNREEGTRAGATSSKKRRHGSQRTGTRRIATEKRSVNPFATARTRFASPCRGIVAWNAPRRSGVETYYSKRKSPSFARSSRGNDTRTRREVTKRVSFLFFFLEGEEESSNRCYPTLVLERFANPILLLGFIKKKLFYFW